MNKTIDLNISALQTEVKDELLRNILPFWMNAVDLKNGGYLGQITGKNEIIYDADKGGILNARILWTFSAAYRILKQSILLDNAVWAKDYLLRHFWDNQYGGVYWSCDYQGNTADTKKQIYVLAFACYALSEFHRATGDEESLEKAIQLFRLIEKYSFDPVKNGYFEAFAMNWSQLDDVRLSAKDANEAKTMNTHLHIVEAYTNLYRVWQAPELKKQIENLIGLFLSRFVDDVTFHMQLFFTKDWEPRHHIVSYGHDIEASWLIHEAALVAGNSELLSKTEPVILNMAHACFEGIQPDGSMAYELNMETGHLDNDRHWWVQAETVAGFINAYQLSKHASFLEKAIHCWQYIKQNIIDHTSGEWFWSVDPDGTANRNGDKLGIWKCPYHNGRMCLEIIERLQQHLKADGIRHPDEKLKKCHKWIK